VAQHRLRAPGPQRVGVVDALTARPRRVDEGHGLVAGVGVARRASQPDVRVEELAQAQSLGQGSGLHQPGVGDGVAVIELGGEAVGAAG
jgi:hypothetical protein